MTLKTTQLIKVTNDDMVALYHANEMIEDFLGMCYCFTLTDEGEIVCEDNGEVFATESELKMVHEVLYRITRIFDEAPSEYSHMYEKQLAIEFNK